MKFDPTESSIIGWMLKNKILTETGKPFDFKSHPFLFDVMCDWSPKQVWLKAPQIGGSIVANLKLLWLVPRKKLNAIYVLPTASDVRDFVSGKTNMLISQNKCLSDLIVDKDSIEQKRIGDNTVYFRGAETERAALSVSSDLNIFDEVDRFRNKHVMEQYRSRLQHSDYKYEWYFSNPSVEGNGVHQLWGRSSQRHWFISCDKCSKKQFLSWPESVDVGRQAFVCKHCNKVLGEEARLKGSWHAAISAIKPEYSGYWFSLLMVPWVTAAEVIHLYQTKSAEYFANFVLGIPFVGNGAKLTEQEFFDNLESGVNTITDPIVIGLDTGLPNWYVVGNRQGIFYNGKCDGYDEIRRLLVRYPHSILVADQGGDLIGVRELQEEYPGRVFLCYYRSDRKTMQIVDWGKGEESGKVIVDRNRMIQQLVDEIRAKRIPLFGSKSDWWQVWLHFANMYRTVEEDANGNERFVWERSGADHSAHACTYWRIGVDKFGLADVTHVGGVTVDKILGVKQSFEVWDDKARPMLETDDSEYDWRN